MSREGLRISPFIVAVAAVSALLWAPVAIATFDSRAEGGALSLSTSSLLPPASVSATLSNCHRNKPAELTISWSSSASGFASAYVMEQAPTSAGPFTVLATLPITQTSYVESVEPALYTTTNYYRVSATFRSWSASSAPSLATAVGKAC